MDYKPKQKEDFSIISAQIGATEYVEPTKRGNSSCWQYFKPMHMNPTEKTHIFLCDDKYLKHVTMEETH